MAFSQILAIGCTQSIKGSPKNGKFEFFLKPRFRHSKNHKKTNLRFIHQSSRTIAGKKNVLRPSQTWVNPPF